MAGTVVIALRCAMYEWRLPSSPGESGSLLRGAVVGYATSLAYAAGRSIPPSIKRSPLDDKWPSGYQSCVISSSVQNDSVTEGRVIPDRGSLVDGVW